MVDLTIIYLTLNALPDKWYKFAIEHLVKAAGNFPIISISRVPMDLGTNLIQTEPKSYWNIYMQLLRGSLLAETDYVANAEDDTLYTKEHFAHFRPPKDKVSYDMSRWCLFTWDNMYCMRQRVNNAMMIAPRELLIEALTERKNRWPNGYRHDSLVGEVGRPIVEQNLRVTKREAVQWYCYNPVVQLNHPMNTHGQNARISGRPMVKKHGQMKAYDIPYWGKATDILRYYHA